MDESLYSTHKVVSIETIRRWWRSATASASGDGIELSFGTARFGMFLLVEWPHGDGEYRIWLVSWLAGRRFEVMWLVVHEWHEHDGVIGVGERCR